MSNREVMDFTDYRNFFEKLKSDNHYARLGKPFATSKKKYFYDTGTGKVLECSEVVFKVLKMLFKEDSFDAVLNLPISQDELRGALDEIKECVEKEHILLAPPVKKFAGAHLQALENYINEGLMQVILEVTEKCNLRCSYCIYGSSNDVFRDFGSNEMSFDTAKKAIDYGVQHSPEKLTVSFYGGEPLLKYDLIKQCITYCKESYPEKDFHFSMTTNLILMDKEKAEYFASIPNFSITCSIDGPQEIHDANRKFANGDGSFRLAMEGLKNMVDALGDEVVDRLNFSMVSTPPFSQEKFDSIQNFFDSLEWLPDDVVKSVSYVLYGRKLEEEVIDLAEKSEDEVNPAGVWTKEKMQGIENLEDMSLFMKKSVHDSLLRIHRRRLRDIPMEDYTFNGCCVPANRRIYVAANGEFKVCEKIGLSPSIGDIDSGVDIDKIKKIYVDDYMRESIKYCKDCWAIHFCSVCYVECFDENGLCMPGKISQCNSQRYMREQGLCMYHELLENNPKALEFLNDVKVE